MLITPDLLLATGLMLVAFGAGLIVVEAAVFFYFFAVERRKFYDAFRHRRLWTKPEKKG